MYVLYLQGMGDHVVTPMVMCWAHTLLTGLKQITYEHEGPLESEASEGISNNFKVI